MPKETVLKVYNNKLDAMLDAGKRNALSIKYRFIVKRKPKYIKAKGSYAVFRKER